jgi:hypothetical protein
MRVDVKRQAGKNSKLHDENGKRVFFQTPQINRGNGHPSIVRSAIFPSIFIEDNKQNEQVKS